MPSVEYSLASEGGSVVATNELSGTYAAANLIDGDDGNLYHSSGGFPITIEITLPFSVLIDQIYLGFVSTQTRSYTIDCFVGGSWVTKQTVSSASEGSHTYNPTPFAATKVRYVVSADDYTIVRLLNFKVFGTPAPDTTPPSDVSGTPTATPVSTSQINLDWADATDDNAVTDYKLERATDSGFTTNLVSGDIGSSTSAKNVTGLSANTTYYFRVKAKDGAGNYSASWSSTFSATTWNVAPTMTNGTTLTTAHQGIAYDEAITTTGGNGTLTVTLKAGSSYPGGLSLSANHLVGTPTTLGSYTFTFVVTDSNGQNSEKTFNLTVDDITAPADMTLGTVTTISASQLNVAFTTPTDNVSVTSLKVQRCQVNTFSGGTLVEFTGVSTSSPYTSTGLSENTTYYYRAKAFDGTNYSTNWSNTVNGTTAYIAPVSGFTLSTATLEAGDTLSITDTSTGTSRTYQWRIGASPTVVSTSATPNLTPNLDNGIIAIKQTVTNPGGSSEVTHNVEVVPKIVSVGNVLTKSISSLSLASGHVFKFRVRSKNSQDVYSDYSNQV